MRIFRLAACLKCRGDLVHDEGDWLCLQCGVYYYTGLYGHTDGGDDRTLRIRRIDPGTKQNSGCTDIGLAS